jgi:hypothetical protein
MRQARSHQCPDGAARDIQRAGLGDPERCDAASQQRERAMSIGTILLIVLILMLIGAVPTWPHSSGWGYGPSGGLGLLVLVVLVLLLMGRL